MAVETATAAEMAMAMAMTTDALLPQNHQDSVRQHHLMQTAR